MGVEEVVQNTPLPLIYTRSGSSTRNTSQVPRRVKAAGNSLFIPARLSTKWLVPMPFGVLKVPLSAPSSWRVLVTSSAQRTERPRGLSGSLAGLERRTYHCGGEGPPKHCSNALAPCSNKEASQHHGSTYTIGVWGVCVTHV